VAGRFRAIKKSSDLIGNRTRDLPACSEVPQPSTLLHAPKFTYCQCKILELIGEQVAVLEMMYLFI
jgi:hypothetical protein